jgi:hypothetical protein
LRVVLLEVLCNKDAKSMLLVNLRCFTLVCIDDIFFTYFDSLNTTLDANGFELIELFSLRLKQIFSLFLVLEEVLKTFLKFN